MRNRRFILLSAVLFSVALATGCYRPVKGPEIVDLPAAEAVLRHIVVGRSVENRPIECILLGEGPDAVFILASIHGDEPAGTVLVRQLAVYLRQNPQLLQGRRVLLTAVANPDGFVHNSRLNVHGVDLNRNFPAANRIDVAMYGQSACSEPEARAIRQLIQKHDINRIVSLHQLTATGPEALVSRVPKGCIDYDGPGENLAERMAKHCELPVAKLGAAPGSLGSYAGLELGMPCITMELPLRAELLGPDLLWSRYGQGLVAAVMYPDEPEKTP